MTQEFAMPKLGHLMEEGTVVSWLKRPGDPVKRDEIIVEIETDKTTVQVESPFAGRLVEILVDEGETVGVGVALALYEDH